MSLRTPLWALAASSLFAVLLLLAVLLPAAGGPSMIEDPRLALPPMQAPGEWFDGARAVSDTPIDFAGALGEADANAAFTQAVAPEVGGLEWDLLGPTNIGGRVVDVVVVPGMPDHVWTAAASGGVWRSTDAGTTWAPSWPARETQAMGALAASSDGTLYAGTGEANPGGGSIVYGGTGLYRSTDLGDSWELVGLEDSGAFGRIVVDPSDPDTVYAAASGNLFVPGGQRGLYRSTDAGETWELLLSGLNDTTGAVDVAVDPSDSDRVLVAMWDHYRSPEARVYAGPGSGVWLTEDGGETWTRIDNIQMPDPAETGRIGVAFAPSDPSRAYAVIANTLDGTHGEWFTSDDGGRTFEVKDETGLAGNNSSYGWWFARIFVDPLIADRLWVAGLELIESLDGGATFVAQSNSLAGVATGAFQGNVHSDQHSMVFSPDVPGLVYLGNDGGVYRSTAGGVAGSWVSGASQGWTQHYSVDVDEQTAEYVVSGLQDNLCQMHVGSFEESSAGWTKYGLCGDGIVTRIDPSDPSTTYYCSQYGGCGRAIAGAPDVRFAMPRGTRYGWLADIQFDPTNSDTLFTGGNSLFRSTNQGNAWVPFSGDLSSDPEQLDPNPGYRLRGVVTTIAVHPDGRTVWVGTDEGRLWVNTDIAAAANDVDNATWTLVGGDNETGELDPDAYAATGLPERNWISSITVDPAESGTAYIAYSGFRDGDDDAKLFVTRDGGATFSPISGTPGEGGLPAAPINDVIVVGDDLLVGTDVGVYLSADQGVTWFTVGDLPASPVLELVFHEPTGTLTAATFGHGIRRTTLPGTTGAASPAGVVADALAGGTTAVTPAG